MAAYALELADLAGAGLGEPAFRSLVLDRRLNGGQILTAVVANDAQAARYARLGETVARLWRDGRLIFHGRLREPLAARPGVLELAAGSPYTLLDRRQLVNLHNYFATDQCAIILGLMGDENRRSHTGLAMATIPYPTVTRDRTYEPGKSIQEIIAQLAGVEGGFYFVERPILDRARPPVLAELELRWPAAGAARPAVRFEYGEGTLANLAGYTLNELLPLNRVTVSGGEPAGGGEAPAPAVAASMPSIARYGMLEAWFSDPDVSEPATLAQKAAARLRPDPVTLVEIEPVAGGPAVGGPPVPLLGRDFDLGDTVTVSVRDETTEVYGLALMVIHTRLTVSPDDDSETVEITLQGPEAVE